ncbi:MAG: hypothetical protein A2X86_08305 [Bdellovibrionales bacterium GWA2_49_15]|nr:MAG: hypothetical protein A2X86_08305 [Bdellovibrionales bacterium GWA2_49_15]HAZ11237.1 hypothetical protein [Bdellovibrionales bacterium]
MDYKEFLPNLGLAKYVECFWTMNSQTVIGAEAKPVRVLPDGCIDIIFDFAHSKQYVVGTMERPLLVTVTGNVDMLGIRFKPGGSQPFLRFMARDCTDKRVDLECFWGQVGSELFDQVIGITGANQRIAHMEKYLRQELNANSALCPYVQYSVAKIQELKGKISIKELERGTGICERQLERKFSKDIGVSPKAFARIVRFANIIKLAQSSPSSLPPNWTHLALTHGYFDQSHLIREFKEFSGVTPSSYFMSDLSKTQAAELG